MTETITISEGRYNRAFAVHALFLILSIVGVAAGAVAIEFSCIYVGWGLIAIGVFYFLCGTSVRRRGRGHRMLSVVGWDVDWVLNDVDVNELAKGPVEVEIHD